MVLWKNSVQKFLRFQIDSSHSACEIWLTRQHVVAKGGQVAVTESPGSSRLGQLCLSGVGVSLWLWFPFYSGNMCSFGGTACFEWILTACAGVCEHLCRRSLLSSWTLAGKIICSPLNLGPEHTAIIKKFPFTFGYFPAFTVWHYLR